MSEYPQLLNLLNVKYPSNTESSNSLDYVDTTIANNESRHNSKRPPPKFVLPKNYKKRCVISPEFKIQEKLSCLL